MKNNFNFLNLKSETCIFINLVLIDNYLPTQVPQCTLKKKKKVLIKLNIYYLQMHNIQAPEV